MTLAMADTTVSLMAAAVSGVIALVALAGQARSQTRLQRLDHDFARRQREEDRAVEAERLVRRYRDPLVFAADQMRNRIHNIEDNDFLAKYGAVRHDHVVHSTVFAVSELLAWAELLRQDQQLVDLAEQDSTRDLNRCLARLGATFSTDRIEAPDGSSSRFMLWRQDQRAIAEMMIERTADGPRCLGYARFVGQLGDDDFRQWFARLLADVEASIADPALASDRLTQLRTDLEDLLGHLDPEGVRSPRDRR